jgi:hypothetical protein
MPLVSLMPAIVNAVSVRFTKSPKRATAMPCRMLPAEGVASVAKILPSPCFVKILPASLRIAGWKFVSLVSVSVHIFFV